MRKDGDKKEKSRDIPDDLSKPKKRNKLKTKQSFDEKNSSLIKNPEMASGVNLAGNLEDQVRESNVLISHKTDIGFS